MKNETIKNMTQAMKKSSYLVLAFLIIGLASCSKEDGADGAIGPQGIAGVDGQDGTNGTNGVDGLNGGADGADGQDGTNGSDGADGSDGQDGDDGNANVISSGWFSFASQDWSFNTAQTLATATRDDAEITQEVMDDAAVLAYIDLGPGNSGVYALPRIESFAYVFYINSVGEIKFRHYKVDGSTVSAPSTQAKFRYIIIPASTSGKSSVDFKNMTYQEVMNHFDLAY